MRIAVCDDEEQYSFLIKKQIENIFKSLDILIDTYQNGNELLESFKMHPYDVVFLDIEMPAVNGISLARKLRGFSEDVVLIFLTGHVEYALEGYEVNALRYLTKPVKADKLREVLNYVAEREKRRRLLWLKTKEGEERVAVSQILYLEAQNQNIVIHTEKKKYVVRYNIGDYEQELKEDGFFRIHRGYLIALGKVKSLRKREVVLEGDICLPVSRSKEKALKEALYQYLKEEAV